MTFRLPRFVLPLLVAFVTLAITASAHAQQPSHLRGIVVSADSGTPIAGAEVALLGLDQQVVTGANGRFDFGPMEAGSYIVQARLVGYTPYTVRANLASASTLDLVFKLNRAGVRLKDLEVTTKEQKTPFMERMEQSNGFGTFVTADDIERRGLRVPSDLFRTVPGVRLTCGTHCTIRVSRAQGLSQANSDCPPLFFLNGARSDITLLEEESIPVYDIEGVEIYRSNGETPAVYSVAGSSCGVIAMWTKTGPKRGR